MNWRQARYPQDRGKQKEHEVRHAGDQPEYAQDACCQCQHHRVPEQLGHQLLADVLLGGDASHHKTGCRGNDQRRYLCHQAIADGEQRVGLGRIARAHVVLQDSDNQSANDVDEQDQDACDSIAADELRGTVHRPVEIRFQRHVRATLARLVLADQTGIEVRIDRHLLARHGVERKACGNLGDPTGALGDDDEIDQGKDDEHHDAHRVISAHQEMAEGLDHLAGGIRPGMAVQQDHARRRHVQRQAQECRDQQHRGKDREIERFHGVHRHQQHHDRNGDVEGEEHVEGE